MFNWSISWKRIPLDPLTNLILKKELLKNITWLHLDRNMRLWTFSWHKIYCRQNRPRNCIVHNVGKLRSPLRLSACKMGTQVPIRMYWILIKCIKVAFTVFLRLCTQPTSSVWKKRIKLRKFNPFQDEAMSNYERFLSLKKTKITASYFRSGSW